MNVSMFDIPDVKTKGVPKREPKHMHQTVKDEKSLVRQETTSATQQRLDHIKTMLDRGIHFTIYHPAHQDDAWFCQTTFWKTAANSVMIQTKEQFGYGSGSSESMDTAVRMILCLIRNYHDTDIEEIANDIKDKVIMGKAPVILKWFMDTDELDVYRGTIFIWDQALMRQVNMEQQRKVEAARALSAKLLKELETQFDEWRQERVDAGKWDDDKEIGIQDVLKDHSYWIKVCRDQRHENTQVQVTQTITCINDAKTSITES